MVTKATKSGSGKRASIQLPERWEQLRLMLLPHQGEVVNTTDLQDIIGYTDRNISKPGRLLDKLVQAKWLKITDLRPYHRTFLITAPKKPVVALPAFQEAMRQRATQGVAGKA